MHFLPRRLFPLLCALASIPPVAGPAQGQEARPILEIREIIVKGNRMVEEDTIRSRIQSREGDPFDQEQVSSDVRAVYDLGFFEDIRVEAEGFEGGLRITFNLKEKPIIRAVTFEGNDKLSESDIRDKLDFAARTIYSAEAVKQAIQQLKAIYREKGYYRSEIDTKTEPVAEGEVNLVFLVDEGEKFHVSSVHFTGNETFSDSKLRSVMKTKKWGLFSLITGSGRLVDEILQEDRQRVLSFYQDNGYLEARVGNPEVSVLDEGRNLEIILPVTEGHQFRLGTLELMGDMDIPLEQIKKKIETTEGEIFRRSVFGKDLFEINQLYTEMGYAYVKVDYSSQLDQVGKVIDVALLVEKGAQTRIGRIAITGNVTTRDKVIRRNITFSEGDLFNSAELRKSRRKITNLGFFESADIIPRPREEKVIDIDIELKEKLTGAFSIGFGYSSEDNISGQLRISESNLFGRGQNLQALAEYGKVRKNYSVSLAEPAVFDSRYSLGFKIFDTSKEYDEYDRKSIGASLTAGRSIGEYFRGFVTVKHEAVDVSDVAENADPIIQEQEGEATTNSVRMTLIRDSRDNFFNPREGNRTALGGEIGGGFLGGDNYFTKFTAESSQFIPLWWKLVFKIAGRFGIVDGFDGREVPIYEKFFVGGIYTVRGFETRSIGPKDEEGNALGGHTQLVFNAEVIFPLDESQGLNFVVFFDIGNTWDKDEDIELSSMRTGAGVGIRWLSPMGPFRLEWGWNLSPREGESGGEWAFAIGGFF